MNSFTKEGPSNDEIKIIGIEFAMRDITGQEHELEMFGVSHTIKRPPDWSQPMQVRFTLHCSDGDRTITQMLRF